MTKVNTMSRAIINLMKSMTKNDALLKLLYFNTDEPLNNALTTEIKKNIMNPRSDDCKIYPFPFSLDGTVEDSTTLRIYYNDGSFDKGEIILDSDIIIDIVTAKSLWLIHHNDPLKGNESMIRPYEIMSRIIDQIGRRSAADGKININGFQHLYVNTKFDAIRIYCSDWSIQTKKTDEK